MKPNVSLIVAASENGVIGCRGRLPWHLSADLRRFRRLTTGHHVILGRKTIESIGRLLPGRKLIVVSRNPDYVFPGAIVVASLESALAATDGDSQPFIAGGAGIYQQSIKYLETIYLTRIHGNFEGDTYFPAIDWTHWRQVESERHSDDPQIHCEYSFLRFQREI